VTRLGETRSPASPAAAARAPQRPRDGRAAECGQQFPPSDGDCHTPLPREVRKNNDTTPRVCCPNSAAPGAGGRTPAQAATERRRAHDFGLIYFVTFRGYRSPF